MIIRSEEIKKLCSTIKPAIDAKSFSILTEVVQLKAVDDSLIVSVTNTEYVVKATLPIKGVEEFNATVKAETFIKLIDSITTESIEFKIDKTNLIIKGNGTYKIPLIFDGSEMLEVPKIDIENITQEFSISSDILRSINTYNSKELQKGTILRPIQNMYYVDEKGAITFTSGACVNSFNLEKPISILLTGKVVKLFNLFDPNTNVNFELGFDKLTDTVVQTKVRFTSQTVCITAIINNDDFLKNSVPVAPIRDRVSKVYPYQIVLDKNGLLQALERISLFINDGEFVKLVAYSDRINIADISGENSEDLAYENGSSNIEDSYTMVINLIDLRITIANCFGTDVSIGFGDREAILIMNGNIKYIIPENYEA